MKVLLNEVPSMKSIMDIYRKDFDRNKSELENYTNAVIDHSMGFYQSMMDDDYSIPDVDWNIPSTVDPVLWNQAVSSILLELALQDKTDFVRVVEDPCELLLRCSRGRDGNFMIQ